MPNRELPRGTNLLTACQARAARAMLNTSVRQMADETKLGESTLRRIETGYGAPIGVSSDVLLKLQAHFEKRGFVFTWNDGHGPGVAWKTYPTDRRRISAATPD